MSESVHSFDPDAAPLPEDVLRRAREEFADWRGGGMPVASFAPTSTDALAVLAKTRSDLAALLEAPDDDYLVMLFPGDAALQHAAAALNLAGSSGEYVVTGARSAAAAREASRLGAATVIAVAEDSVPDLPASQRGSYLHLVLNEPSTGLSFPALPPAPDSLRVADASTDFPARRRDLRAFGVLYASLHPLGARGVGVAIVRRELVGRATATCPSALDYAVAAESGFADGVPPFGVYLAGLACEGLLARGGWAAVEQDCRAKAERLYAEIDRSGFYVSRVRRAHRSHSTVIFSLRDPSLRAAFLAGARQRGLTGLARNPRSDVLCAAVYPGTPGAAVHALADHLRDFEQRSG